MKQYLGCQSLRSRWIKNSNSTNHVGYSNSSTKIRLLVIWLDPLQAQMNWPIGEKSVVLRLQPIPWSLVGTVGRGGSIIWYRHYNQRPYPWRTRLRLSVINMATRMLLTLILYLFQLLLTVWWRQIADPERIGFREVARTELFTIQMLFIVTLSLEMNILWVLLEASPYQELLKLQTSSHQRLNKDYLLKFHSLSCTIYLDSHEECKTSYHVPRLVWCGFCL